MMSVDAPATLIRILVVDDTPTIRLLFQRMFTASGVFDVVGEAANGHEGVELAKRHQPDIILLDLAMPVVNGFQAIPSMVAECPDSLIIVLSGFNTDSAGEQALKLGAHAYIEKRHRPDELLRQIVDIYRSRMATRVDQAEQDTFKPVDRVNDAHPAFEPDPVARAPHEHKQEQEQHQHQHQQQEEPHPVVRQLESSNAELARSNAGLASFAAIAAHDLRSPLHVVVGFSELLATDYGDRLDEHGREMIDSIVSGAHRMEQMIEGLLAHCRLDGPPPAMVEVSLDDVVATAMSTLAADIERRRAVVTRDSLPVVIGDPVQLQSLVQNLLANALKFSYADIDPRVHISAQRSEGGWKVTVQDNGIGIDASKRDQIFGMFVRLHTKGEYGGTGIGLASCKRIVDAHGGTIHVEDNPTGGSRFIVDLPDREAVAETAADDIAADGEQDPAPERPLDVLLVEDSLDHAKLINALLRRAPAPGYRLHHVGTVEDARHVLSTTEMDCVLLDLSLPDANNLEALSEIRSAASLVAIVVITSSADEALAFAAVSQGAQDYLVKGHIDSDQLSRAIRWSVQRKTLENELTRDALHDPLTRLPNRTLMLDRLASALARAERSGKKVVVFFMDLDGFKLVNDRFGHEAGDHFLIVMAERLRGAIRPQDTVARIGGDEFVVICEGFNGHDFEWQPLQRRLIAAVEIPMEIAGHSVRVSASIGLSVGGRDSDPESMLRDADLAMYAMKRSR